jgi:N-acetylmuramoyl-L-alanine amidase
MRPGDPIGVVDTLIIHGTDGNSTADAVAAWHDREASAHWIIPDENEQGHGEFAWATAAESKAAWHCRKTSHSNEILGPGPKPNSRSLGIEIVNRITGGGDPYSEWQVRMAAEIALYAWAKYPNLRTIISHAKLDPTRRSDPGPAFPWETFRNEVLSHAALHA